MITITEKNGFQKNFPAESYVLITLEEGRVKANGDIDIRALLPLLMKLPWKDLLSKVGDKIG